MEGLEHIVAAHAFFAGLEPSLVALVSGCAKNARFEAGKYLFREGESADWFYLLREGRVALELRDPARGAVTLQTLGPGEVCGLSWLAPPYRWSYDARALDNARAIAIDAACLRRKSEADPRFGYEMMKRFMPPLIERLQATRLQMIDIYGAHG
ncbi:Crp/Fnr family transcriptional regulator [Methylosinus trichosporium OB3b]|uniref:Crp/Fnr family transcriptional regulator n=1 Tax=Methylosinus trichosporium (strain ATCC 35070 / NCIMB 11131 / UNIQEM 75 / OB3b) TaxID=595536 RepID=A0A2D2D6P7_METT3|nr:Crp/Fnr family transcriptional regulator [Methylosinus trichosporium OB3b]OBS51131.1 Crp/Fnr family transcriptional regulator [Methylosinus sp. 3S-1]